MKSYRKELWFDLPQRLAFVNITGQVQDCIRESGIGEGLVLVNAMHITASVFINDDESGLHADYDKWLEKLAPHEPTSQYQHNRTGEDNADAHMKRQVMGREVVVAITDGKLDFGPWEQIFYGEFDGRLWGPGVLDMKAGIAFFLAAARILRELDISVPRRVLLQLNCDEEIGSHSSRALTEKNAAKSDVVLVLEPGTGLTGKLKTARKGVGDYHVVVRGKASHAGVDFEAGASAI